MEEVSETCKITLEDDEKCNLHEIVIPSELPEVMKKMGGMSEVSPHWLSKTHSNGGKGIKLAIKQVCQHGPAGANAAGVNNAAPNAAAVV